MRVDDDYVWGGGYLHGLYDVESRDTKGSICLDFLEFCKLAVAHQVLPGAWDWARCLSTAAKLLPYALEEQDAQKKWGGENAFSGILGGRSLRYTGERVYGTSTMEHYGEDPEVVVRVRQKLQPWESRWRKLVTTQGGAKLFQGVGGQPLWRKLHDSMPAMPGNF